MIVLKNITKKLIRYSWDNQSFVMITNETNYIDVFVVDWSKIAENKPN